MDSTFFREKIMNLRDVRIKLQRQIVALKDLNFWEPWSFTPEHEHKLKQLEHKVESLKHKEQLLHNYIYKEI